MRTKQNPLTRITGKNGQVRYKKKVHGVIYYFGSRGCTEKQALDDYMARKDGLFAGNTGTPADGITLEVAVNEVLHEKKAASETGEISLKHHLTQPINQNRHNRSDRPGSVGWEICEQHIPNTPNGQLDC